MRPVLKKEALFSDGTKDYRDPTEPEAGEKVTIRFRTGRNNVDIVWLCTDCEHYKMKKTESDREFDYYAVEMTMGEEPFYYYFEVASGLLHVFFDRYGVSKERRDAYRFCIIPGFSTPEWSKGAVMYQILVDRFYNGDPANDVLTDEYYYIQTPSKKMEDWNQCPSDFSVENVLRSMWERGWSFIKKAGTIILLSTIVLWFLMNFGWADGSFGMLEAEQLDSSILAAIGSVIAPIFAPLGWGNWKMAVAAITGLIAKENVVATFGILFGFAEVAEDGAEIWGQLGASIVPIAAYGFLVFNLLCAPCFAAMGAIKREMNNTKWFWFAIGYQTVLAYIVAFCIYQIGSVFTGNIHVVGLIIALLFVAGFIYLLVRPYKESDTLKVDMKKKAFAK